MARSQFHLGARPNPPAPLLLLPPHCFWSVFYHPYNAMQCNAIQWSAVLQCNWIQCKTMQYLPASTASDLFYIIHAMQWNGTQWNTIEYTAIHLLNALHFTIVLGSAPQCFLAKFYHPPCYKALWVHESLPTCFWPVSFYQLWCAELNLYTASLSSTVIHCNALFCAMIMRCNAL